MTSPPSIFDEIIKWTRIKRNFYGVIAWMLIILLLAGDFAYWASAIDTDPPPKKKKVVPGEVNYTVIFEVPIDTSISIQFARPQTDSDSVEFSFPVNENATIGFINVTIWSGVLNPSMKVYLYDSIGNTIYMSQNAEIYVLIILDNKTLEAGGLGEWKIKVDPYSGINISFDTTVTIGYLVPEVKE